MFFVNRDFVQIRKSMSLVAVNQPQKTLLFSVIYIG
ncbi:hypothetical protein Sesv_3149 [Salmonella enterica subsp. enterica serovar Virchow str. SVQ1]|uniref:Uncharacterized protein n=2 Tax=Salmonella enterica I TaxID=59201 RepID=A0A0F6B7V6_SALT1|nr:hypothetical protein SPAB_04355 [Salmonella enterica subsp. enterica serovar Paratyphi B str. SPB7]ACY90604.1 hypothetical protein STM14_4214 [Salmonella enterica subsp. enterica serovar Typhimurium str. 14028S]ETO87758.1 hypothetical protein Sesv_3149 [Salmonella enterica subsp. enterica serovar Virchow str. SVQ1]